MQKNVRKSNMVCEYLDKDLIEDLYERTEETGLEYGVSICEDGRTDIVKGEKDWIDTPKCQVDDSLSINIHTHPSNNIGLSANDWRSFVTENLQYPEGTKFDEDMKRASCIVGKRMGDDGVTAHCVRMTDEARNLSIKDQRGLSKRILSDIRDEGLGFGGINPVSKYDEIDDCYITF